LIARFARRLAPHCGIGLALIGASLLYHYPSLFAGVVSVEDDLKVFYFPLLVATAHALTHGQLALWTPAMFGGYPLFADGEAGMLYPLHLLVLPWLAPEAALVLLRVVHSVLAGAFTYLLLRTLDTRRIAGLVAGLVYAYSGFAAGQIIHVNVFQGLVWLPLELCLVERTFNAAPGARLQSALLAGAVFGIQALAIHIHVTLMSALAVGLFVAYRAVAGIDLAALANVRDLHAVRRQAAALVMRIGTGAGLIVLIAVVGIGIAAVQLLPLAELGYQTSRGSGLGARAANVNSIWWGDLLTLLLPRLYDTASSGYWGLWVKWETVFYVGVAPLMLAVLGLVAGRGRHRGFFAALGALGLLLAFGSNTPLPGWDLLHSLPGFEVLRSPGRFSLLFALAVAVLAGYGVEWLAAGRSPRPRAALAALMGGAALWVLANMALGWASQTLATSGDATWLLDQYLRLPGVPPIVDGVPLTRDRLAGLAAAALDPTAFWPAWQLLLLPATGVALALWLLGGRTRPAAVCWTLALVFVDLWTIGLTFHPYMRLEALRPQVPPVLVAHADEPFRVYTPPTAEEKLTDVEPNRLLTARVEEANGYSSLEPDRHAAYVGAIQFIDNDLLDLWNVRYVVRRNRPELLPSYAGTSFHPQRPLFSGRTATPGAGGTLLPDGGDARVDEVIVISSLWNAVTVPDGQQVARVVLRGADGQTRELSLLAGPDVSDGRLDVPGVPSAFSHGRAPVAFQYQATNPAGDRYGEQLYAGRLSVSPAMTVTEVEVQPATPFGGLQIYGVGLFDAITGEVTQARQKRKFNLVYRDDQIRIFENTRVMPRAFLVPQARVAGVGQDVLAHMVSGPFDPRTTAVVEDPPAGLRLPPVVEDPPSRLQLPTANAEVRPGQARIESYRDDSVVVRTAADASGVLVLTDTFYPGWAAEIDGRPTPILRTDYLFRGVVVPAGEHVVTFAFRPWSVMLGAVISLLTACFVLVMALVPLLVALGRRVRLARPAGLSVRGAPQPAGSMAEVP
jgi:hypothetical protein